MYKTLGPAHIKVSSLGNSLVKALSNNNLFQRQNEENVLNTNYNNLTKVIHISTDMYTNCSIFLC